MCVGIYGQDLGAYCAAGLPLEDREQPSKLQNWGILLLEVMRQSSANFSKTSPAIFGSQISV